MLDRKAEEPVRGDAGRQDRTICVGMARNRLADLRRQGHNVRGILKARVVNRGRLAPVRFVLFGRARSGTTALVRLLDSLPHVRCDGEILNPPVWFPYARLLAGCSNSHARIYGCKVLSYQVRLFRDDALRNEFVRRLTGDGFRIVYLKRENLIFHALSQIRARDHGFEMSSREAWAPPKHDVDVDELTMWMKRAQAMETFEQRQLEDVPHLALTYEKHISDQDVHQRTVDEVCAFLGIDSAPAALELQKVSPRTLRDSIENYDEVAAALRGTQYDAFLE